jgi:hypothetical protein
MTMYSRTSYTLCTTGIITLPAPTPLHHRLAPPFVFSTLDTTGFQTRLTSYEALPGPDAALCHLVTSLNLFGQGTVSRFWATRL